MNVERVSEPPEIGAEFKVGDKVVICRRGDETTPEAFLWKEGRVKDVIVCAETSVGESDESPLVIVAVPFVGTDAFWPEELERVL